MQLRRSGRRTKYRGVRALTVLTAVIAAIAIGGAIPASAAPHTAWTVDPGKPNGSARFGEIDDHIYLCDHRADGHGVGVHVEYIHEDSVWDWTTDWYWYSGGAGGCKTIDLRVREDTYIFFYVCLADHTTKGGLPPNKIERTCSATEEAFNDNVW